MKDQDLVDAFSTDPWMSTKPPNNPSSLPLCGAVNQACVQEVLSRRHDTGSLPSQHAICHAACQGPPCFETQYHAQVSDVVYADTVFRSMEQNPNITNGQVTQAKEYYAQNFMEVTVNFAALEYELWTESPAMTTAQLLAAIGGSLEFFLGASALGLWQVAGDFLLCTLVPR